MKYEKLGENMSNNTIQYRSGYKYQTAKKYKDKADKLFKKICIEDGVPSGTAQIYYLGLKLGGKPSTDPKNKKEIHTAP